ncbi:hypothetical protein EJ03DRAFT_351168 [Teratosphaeria nubilosa]|uniref:Uncharacterized protein n=1 Tax=Teratosphaeria nubilosa TaxID=161662 RepID=A0A6G1L9Q9_9PEZI|nr:hypothetical protein EJ03DRAFT_351168 [Teratosphaeria nubilosa]
MASPLFIFAATICRSIADPTWDANDQLNIVLKQLDQVDMTLLDAPAVLKRNLCSVKALGYQREQVPNQVLAACIPTTISYACQYWVAHLAASGREIIDHDIVSKFLMKRSLHWVEALSWLGETYSVMKMIDTLETCVHATGGGTTASLLNDAKHWIAEYRRAVDIAPLQIYACALSFVPKQSVIRSLFGTESLQRVSVSDLPEYWSAPALTLDGRKGMISSLAFCPDGHLLASGSLDHTIRLWEIAAGRERWQTTVDGIVYAVDFSPSGQWLAIQLEDQIEIWDCSTMQRHCRFTQQNIADFEFITDETVMYSRYDQPGLLRLDIHQHANESYPTSHGLRIQRWTCRELGGRTLWPLTP